MARLLVRGLQGAGKKPPPHRRHRKHGQNAFAILPRGGIHFSRLDAICDPLLLAIVLRIFSWRVAHHPQSADAKTLVRMGHTPASRKPAHEDFDGVTDFIRQLLHSEDATADCGLAWRKRLTGVNTHCPPPWLRA